MFQSELGNFFIEGASKDEWITVNPESTILVLTFLISSVHPGSSDK